jgi:hypothetical protein
MTIEDPIARQTYANAQRCPSRAQLGVDRSRRPDRRAGGGADCERADRRGLNSWISRPEIGALLGRAAGLKFHTRPALRQAEHGLALMRLKP